MSSLIITLLIIVGLFSCEKDNGQVEDENLKVVSSFTIISEIIKTIGGDLVEVHNLVPVGTDPHEYEPKPEDIKFASKADVFVYNGLNLEGGDHGWFMRLVRSVKANPDRVYRVTDEIEPMYLTEKDGSQEVNPHAFISPVVGIAMTKAIRDLLIDADPENKETYQENAVKYILELEEIDQEYRDKISQIPEEQRIFMASEQAFQYLATEYGLKEGFIWAIDTDENGSPEQIKAAINFVRDNQPPVLFVESNVNTKPMETVSRETGVPIYKPAIFSDELGRPGQQADTYIKYLEYNLKHIIHGLSGHAKWEDQ